MTLLWDMESLKPALRYGHVTTKILLSQFPFVANHFRENMNLVRTLGIMDPALWFYKHVLPAYCVTVLGISDKLWAPSGTCTAWPSPAPFLVKGLHFLVHKGNLHCLTMSRKMKSIVNLPLWCVSALLEQTFSRMNKWIQPLIDSSHRWNFAFENNLILQPQSCY